jgi:hypothetical protein
MQDARYNITNRYKIHDAGYRITDRHTTHDT